MFRPFLSSEDERKSILALSEEDARLFIEIIDGVRLPRTVFGSRSPIFSLDVKAFRDARLEPRLRQLALYVLGELCGRIGHLPNSYLLSDKFDLSGIPHASGGFADLRRGALKGRYVTVKTLRVYESDDSGRIRKVGNQATSFHQFTHTVQRFCKEVAIWKNLSHPNILSLIGVPDTLEDGRFSMVSEWMANGNIVEYVRSNAGNHIKLVGYRHISLCHY